MTSRTPVPIFPLPESVFFPTVSLPLHVFEPRYRQMTEDALAGDARIAVVLLRPGWERNYYGNPPVHAVATVGRIEHHEALPEGRYNIVLRGLERVRLLVPEGGECPPGKLYRIRVPEPAAEVRPEPGTTTLELRDRLRAMWRELEQKSGRLPTALETGSLEELVNGVAGLVDVPSETKQGLLEEDDLLARAARLEGYLTESLRLWRVLARFREIVPDDPRVN